jgi:Fe-S-cluster containining protein
LERILMTFRRTLPMLYGGYDAGPRPDTREQVCAASERGVDPVLIAAHVANGVSELWTACLTASGNAEPIPACSRGCSYCCHQRVEVTAPEAFLIARALVGAPSERLQRIHAAAARHARLSSREHFSQQCACPLLDDDGACSVYDARPTACRRAHSTDVEVCRALAQDPSRSVEVPVAPALDWNTSALVLGYYEGMAHAGMPPHQYELAGAVSLALEVDDVEARWRRGEDILAEARTRDAAELRVVLGGGAGS